MASETADPTSTLEGGLAANRGPGVIACAVIFAVLCTIFLVLRFVSHAVGNRGRHAEDWTMIPAYVLMMGLCANVICSVTLGDVGRHQEWVLLHEPERMESWAKTLFVTEFLYGILVATEKTSIILLYLRIFHIQRWFRHLSWAMIVYVWLWAFSELLVAVFQCKPVAFQWDTSLEGTCIDRLAFYRWISVPNLLHDVALLLVPAPMVWKLQVSTRQKAALGTVFLLGSFGCVASIIRMYYFFKLNALSDDNWASIQLMSWTCAEPGVIFICACMPSLWPLIRKTFRLDPSKVDKSHKMPPGIASSGDRSDQSRFLGGSSAGTAIRPDNSFIRLQDLETDAQKHMYHATSFHAPRGATTHTRDGINVKREVTVEARHNIHDMHYGMGYNGRN